MAVTLASLDDINANLQGEDLDNYPEATDENTMLLQISIARIVRGYLASDVDQTTLMSWKTPETTPEIIREVAGQLIASQLFFNQTAQQSITVEERHYAQILYDRAMATLNGIIAGTMSVIGDDGTLIDITAANEMSELDFWPVDDTDRSFTKSRQFY